MQAHEAPNMQIVSRKIKNITQIELGLTTIERRIIRKLLHKGPLMMRNKHVQNTNP